LVAARNRTAPPPPLPGVPSRLPVFQRAKTQTAFAVHSVQYPVGGLRRASLSIIFLGLFWTLQTKDLKGGLGAAPRYI
jgi:hypothetical protein